MNKDINKKEILAKFKKKIAGKILLAKPALKSPVQETPKVETITYFIREVDHNIIVENLEKKFLALNKSGIKVTNPQEFPKTEFPKSFDVDNVKKPDWYVAPKDNVKVTGEVEIKGTIKTEAQDNQSGVMAVVAGGFGQMVKFLSQSIFKVERTAKDAATPQAVMLYDPIRKELVDPKELFNFKMPSISVNGGGSATPIATTVLTGQKTANTGVPVAIGNAPCLSVTIKAKAANTGKIYVGAAGVTTATGFELSAGDSISMDVGSLNVVFIVPTVSAEGVTFIYIGK